MWTHFYECYYVMRKTSYSIIHCFNADTLEGLFWQWYAVALCCHIATHAMLLLHCGTALKLNSFSPEHIEWIPGNECDDTEVFAAKVYKHIGNVIPLRYSMNGPLATCTFRKSWEQHICMRVMRKKPHIHAL